MGLVTGILGLPFAPIRGLVSLAEILRDHAERELHDPARIRRELEEVENAAARGEISEKEKEQLQEKVLRPLITRSRATAIAEAKPNEGK